jgi:hypothetical protein
MAVRRRGRQPACRHRRVRALPCATRTCLSPLGGKCAFRACPRRGRYMMAQWEAIRSVRPQGEQLTHSDSQVAAPHVPDPPDRGQPHWPPACSSGPPPDCYSRPPALWSRGRWRCRVPVSFTVRTASSHPDHSSSTSSSTRRPRQQRLPRYTGTSGARAGTRSGFLLPMASFCEATTVDNADIQ